MDVYEVLRIRFAGESNISDVQWRSFCRKWEEVSYGRKEDISPCGKIEQYAYFVIEGTQRIVYISEEGKEATLAFTYKGDFGGVLDSFLLQIPARFSYESLSTSKLLRCSRSNLLLFFDENPSMKPLFDRLVYEAFTGTLTRMVDLQILSSEQKFIKMLKRSPHILTKIPHKYLANYIGIDPTNFSKLLNSIKI